jgi:hypothetical protein
MLNEKRKLLSEKLKVSTFESYTLGARFNLSDVEDKYRPEVLTDFSSYTVGRAQGCTVTFFESLALSHPLKATRLAQDAYKLLQEKVQVSQA